MGSLMPGWDLLPNSTKIMKQSKSSLTKEEIEVYWRYKRQGMEALSKEKNAQNANTVPTISETKLTSTTTFASNGTKAQEVAIEWLEATASSPDWWTRSNWAYLNAPPKMTQYPGQSRHPYISELDASTQFNRSISSIV